MAKKEVEKLRHNLGGKLDSVLSEIFAPSRLCGEKNLLWLKPPAETWNTLLPLHREWPSHQRLSRQLPIASGKF